MSHAHVPTLPATSSIRRQPSLAILRHDGTCSVVSVNGPGEAPGTVWVQFGEVTEDGFSPCYAALVVDRSDLRTVIF